MECPKFEPDLKVLHYFIYMQSAQICALAVVK